MAASGVVKHSEQLRRAVRWVAEQRLDRPEVPLAHWLSEAGPLFSLSPNEQEGLSRLLRESDRSVESSG
jgi:hypothetical protein